MIINTKFLEPRNFIAIGLLAMIFKIFYNFLKTKFGA